MDFRITKSNLVKIICSKMVQELNEIEYTIQVYGIEENF